MLYFKRVLVVCALVVSGIPGGFLLAAEDTSAFRIPQGYRAEFVARRLSAPTALAFDGNDMIVAEAGVDSAHPPRVLRISLSGDVAILASEGLSAPVTGILVLDDGIYISHKRKVSVIPKEGGPVRDIVTGLPSNGDYQNTDLVIGPDGKIHIGQGTATNSGVVGVDNFENGWLQEHQTARDVPCKDTSVFPRYFESPHPLTPQDDWVVTGSYKPFGDPPTWTNEVIPGNVKCTGSILRFNRDGSDLQVAAWGLRNPEDLAFDAAGQLWTVAQAAEDRGSRPVRNDKDVLILVRDGGWYGWPDYFAGQPREPFLWREHPALQLPYMTFDADFGIESIAFSGHGGFGYVGDAFIAGDSILRVDIESKRVEEFASSGVVETGQFTPPDTGWGRPVDLVFGPDGALYVVDRGILASSDGREQVVAETGSIWRVYPETMTPLALRRPVNVAVQLLPNTPQGALGRTLGPLFSSWLSLQVIASAYVLGVLTVFVVITNRFARGRYLA